MRSLLLLRPGRWRPRPLDVLVVLALLVLSLEPLREPTGCGCESTPPWGVVLVVVQGVVLLWRRRAPFVTGLTAGVLAAAQGVSALPEPVLPFAALVGLYSVAALCDRVRARVGAGLAAVGIAVALLLDPAGPPDLQDVTFLYLVFATAWLLGDGARHRREQLEGLRERSAALEAFRVARERQAVAKERASIARELHDVIAHSVGLMVVQAESGAVLAGRDPSRAEPAFDAVARTGREALVELRQLLGVLHEQPDGEADGAPDRSPAPTLAALPELAADVTTAGLRVELDVRGEPRTLPPAVDLSAYRIAQEALTNVLRHAGASRARVVVDWSATEVRVSVTDDGRRRAPAVPRQGRGLVGMRERASVVGGQLHAGPRPGGGWEVLASLPVAAPAQPTITPA